MPSNIRKNLVNRGESGDSRTGHDSRMFVIAVLGVMTALRGVFVTGNQEEDAMLI